jgi:hypothetical protein
MSNEPQLFRVNPDSWESDRIEEVDFAELGWKERQDIQEWVAANPSILGDDLLIVGKEFSDFDLTNERLDLLAADSDGKLVIIELKRDDTGADAHWQAIKYASYFQRASADDIIRIMADYEKVSQDDAVGKMLQHLGTDDLNGLNNDQRIILASHRFAPEVTSAVLWLNDKAPGENLITCVKLTPFRDTKTDTLYIQASAIIPVPGLDDYVVSVGSAPAIEGSISSSKSLGEKLTATFAKNRNDEVTHFLRDKVGNQVIDGLQPGIKPDMKSRWAGDGGEFRYYHFWYKKWPWENWGTSYRVNLLLRGENLWLSSIEFVHGLSNLQTKLAGVNLHPDQQLASDGIKLEMGTDTLNDEFAGRIAKITRKFIEQITPIVDDLQNESDGTEA